VQLTQELIRLRSVNPPGNEEACARLVGGVLGDAGFAVTAHSFAEDRTSIVASLPGSGDRAPICFTGHLDTVPLGAAPWERDPLAAEIDGDRLYGRGSSDMKSGIAALVTAARELARLPNRKSGLVLIFTAGEETGCDGARHLASLPDVLPKVGALVVGEPTGNDPMIGHKGALWLKAVFRGVTAHGSMPELGDNAVLKAARSVLRLSGHRFHAEAHHHLGRPSLNIGSLHGGMNVNSVPDQAEVQIDIRTVPGQSNETIRQEIANLLEEGHALTRMVDVGCVASDPQTEWISEVFDLCEQRLGGRVVPRGVPFFTDASVLTPAMNDVPTLILGPGETAMAHKTDEYCLMSRIDAAVDLYIEIGRRWIAV
jgi:succinyl-diaminopimelate desuccinylase